MFQYIISAHCPCIIASLTSMKYLFSLSNAFNKAKLRLTEHSHRVGQRD